MKNFPRFHFNIKSIKHFDGVTWYPIVFTLIFITFIIQYPFYSLEGFFYDLRVVNDVGVSYQDQIIIVTLDEESDEFLGERFPYTYTSHYKFISKMISDRPKVINYLINMDAPQSSTEKVEQLRFKNFVERFQRTGGAFRFGTTMDSWGEQLPPNQLMPLGYSLALLHVDSNSFTKDEVARRGILSISGEESLHLWTSNRYLKSMDKRPMGPKIHQGSYYLPEADAMFALFRYYSSPEEKKGKITKIPFHRVLVGNFPKGFFKDKIVLVGSQYNSKIADFILTPFNQEDIYKTPRLNVHAMLINALIEQKTVYQIPRWITHLLCFIFGLFLSLVISKVRPTRGLLITLSMMIGVLLIAYLLFTLFGMWLYVSHLILTIFIVYYIWVPFRAMAEYQTRYTIEEESKMLKRVEHLKQNFISLMSHDLKTPVAKIAGIADILQQQYRHQPEQYQLLQNIIIATKDLNKFITSILDLTKVESEELNLKLISKDINQFLQQEIEQLKYEASLKELTIKTQFAPLYPIKVDGELIKRVFSNILENAIKYSHHQGTIDVTTWDDEQWVYIKICDQGIGIESESLKHVFDKFYRVPNDANHVVKGSGLGLYLVKYFIELHQGKISVESTPGKGTCFLIQLKNR